MTGLHPDGIALKRDDQRRAYLAAVLARMGEDPAEDARIRGLGRDLLARKRKAGLVSSTHTERWERLLELPLKALADTLLATGAEGVEMRHAHMLPGALPAREANRIRKDCVPEITCHDTSLELPGCKDPSEKPLR